MAIRTLPRIVVGRRIPTVTGLAIGLSGVAEAGIAPIARVVAIRTLPRIVVGGRIPTVTGLAIGLSGVAEAGIAPIARV
ncbi:MAG TPA: hypothetical protein VI451_16805, partial [Anaerolineales bacterium]|nr:hypothetical protein [Anaerolineales bacterium]